MEPVRVPNEFPTKEATARLAVVGEAPGAEEEAVGRPFVGHSGRLLERLLERAGLARGSYFIGNVCQVRPPGNDITRAEPAHLDEGRAQLRADLDRYRPNCVLLLGQTAFSASRDDGAKVSKWRGSIYAGTGALGTTKCVGTLHPAYCLRSPGVIPVVAFDVARAAKEAESPELQLPIRAIDHAPSLPTILAWLARVRQERWPLSFDIEGYAGGQGITSISFSTVPHAALVVAFEDNRWTEEEEGEIWKALAAILEDPSVPKIAQNAFYELFVLAYTHGIVVRGIVGDTMLAHFELNCELEKNLGFLASFYTREPYYKQERTSEDLTTKLIYNGKDSAVTMEIWDKLNPKLTKSSRDHYNFNLKMWEPLAYMGLRGMRWDKDRAAEMAGQEAEKVNVLTAQLQEMAEDPKFNPRSSQQVQKFLFGKLGLPIKYKRKKKSSDEDKVTTDYESLLALVAETDHPAVHKMIWHRHHTKRLQYINMPTDPDGRIRCSYNIVGTETGRLSCSSSPSGSGDNLQTVPDDLRCLVLADEGMQFFQCDLSGADGWTVAAHCAGLGDSTMLDDYLYGLKPAQILCLAHRHGEEIFQKDRDELKKLSGTVLSKEWDYFVSKKIQHGSNYGMKPPTLRAQIVIESEGKVSISIAQAKRFQYLYFRRYPGILRWHAWAQQELRSKGFLAAPNGHVRRFLGPRTAHETLKEYLAHEPQMNTTWATNLATLFFWDCMCVGGTSEIEILHSVHDALCGQFREGSLGMAAEMARHAFDNPIRIHGVEVNIPFEGKWGRSWGELEEKL